jgi:predicted lipoprotein with Yx(FWY)xxD motif
MSRKIFWLSGVASLALLAALAFSAGVGAAAPPAEFLQATAMPTEMPMTTGTPSASGGAMAAPGATVQLANNATLGNILTDNAGMTLYVFKNDTPGISNCTGTCAQNWPPLTVTAGQQPVAGTDVTGQLGVITRADGTTQVTYNGMPLYRFVGDKAPGDTNGQGLLNGAWSVALVTAAAPAAPAAATPQAPSSY